MADCDSRGSTNVTVENVDHVRVISLNRAEKMNALNLALTRALHSALVAAGEDEGVRAVVLAGKGRAFCAGADVTEFDGLRPNNGRAVLRRAQLTTATHMLLGKIAKPVVAAVHGAALGGGAGLALASDLIVVAEDTRLGFPELSKSVVPAIVMTSIQRNVSRKLAFELISTGRLLSGSELAALNIANRKVSSPAEAVRSAIALAQQCAGVVPSAMAAAKDLFYRVADLPTGAAMRTSQDVNVLMREYGWQL